MPEMTPTVEALEHLRTKDAILGAYIDQVGLIRREMVPDLFQGLISSIISQQISTKAAQTIKARLFARMGDWQAECLHALEIEEVQAMGMSFRKAGYLKKIAADIVEGRLDLEAVATLDDEALIKALVALPGIGVWTAEMLLIFSLQRPDVISFGDLGIHRGLQRIYGLEKIDRATFEALRRNYQPYSSTASLYLWHKAAE